jgi:hypothetical protein
MRRTVIGSGVQRVVHHRLHRARRQPRLTTPTRPTPSTPSTSNRRRHARGGALTKIANSPFLRIVTATDSTQRRHVVRVGTARHLMMCDPRQGRSSPTSRGGDWLKRGAAVPLGTRSSSLRRSRERIGLRIDFPLISFRRVCSSPTRPGTMSKSREAIQRGIQQFSLDATPDFAARRPARKGIVPGQRRAPPGIRNQGPSRCEVPAHTSKSSVRLVLAPRLSRPVAASKG